MDGARLTDERLRFGLNGDQSARERMCTALLNLDRSYTDIRPRRPEGGPDGSRDIEARWRDAHCVGAVGFLNRASDTPEQRRQIKKKFRDDLLAAKASVPDARGFVFFCNLDLTPREVDGFVELAREQEMTHVDVYWRERMRILLDSPEGLAARFQFLALPLSEAEQAAFFGRFGNDLETLVRGRFDDLSSRIDDLDRSICLRQVIRSLRLDLILKGGYRDGWSDEHPHFRCILELRSIPHLSGRSIVLGCRDNHHWSNGRCAFGSKNFFWFEPDSHEPDKQWIPASMTAYGGAHSKITTGVRWSPESQIQLAEIEQLSAFLYVTENLLPELETAVLTADHFVLFDISTAHEEFREAGPNHPWPGELTDVEREIPWRGQHIHLFFREIPPVPLGGWCN